MIIYKITNTINGKIYIGQTTGTIKQRFVHHCGKWSSCTYLKNAIQLYGQENFTIEELYRAESIEELNKKEESFIIEFDSLNPDKGYNIRPGGNNSKPTEESKLRMRISSTGKKHSEETKRKMSDMRKNYSDETRAKMAEGQKRRKELGNWSEETKIKLKEQQNTRRVKALKENPMFGLTVRTSGKYAVLIKGKYLGVFQLEEAKIVRDNYIKNFIDKPTEQTVE